MDRGGLSGRAHPRDPRFALPRRRATRRRDFAALGAAASRASASTAEPAALGDVAARPAAFWRALRRWPSPPGMSDGDQADDHSLKGLWLGTLRDFGPACAEHERAIALAPDDPWLRIEYSYTLMAQDRVEDALARAREALEIQPGYRSGTQVVARALSMLGRGDEAVAMLRDAVANTECSAIPMQLAELLIDRRTHDAAGECGRARPAQRAAGGCADAPGPARRGARGRAASAGTGFYSRLAERLVEPPEGETRVLLRVPFIRQHWATCAPATLTALSHFWDCPAEHLEVAQAICYDGTSDANQRVWAEQQGFVVRDFRLDWTSACALIDAGVPFALVTKGSASGHLQAVAGYDRLRGTLLIRDPFLIAHAEMEAEPLFSSQAAHGPRAMVMLPASQRHRLDGIVLPDADDHDELYRLQTALERHARGGGAGCAGPAGAALARQPAGVARDPIDGRLRRQRAGHPRRYRGPAGDVPGRSASAAQPGGLADGHRRTCRQLAGARGTRLRARRRSAPAGALGRTAGPGQPAGGPGAVRAASRAARGADAGAGLVAMGRSGMGAWLARRRGHVFPLGGLPARHRRGGGQRLHDGQPRARSRGARPGLPARTGARMGRPLQRAADHAASAAGFRRTRRRGRGAAAGRAGATAGRCGAQALRRGASLAAPASGGCASAAGRRRAARASGRRAAAARAAGRSARRARRRAALGGRGLRAATLWTPPPPPVAAAAVTPGRACRGSRGDDEVVAQHPAHYGLQRLLYEWIPDRAEDINRVLDRLSEHHPQDAWLHRERAVQASRQGRHDEAVAAAETACVLTPERADAHGVLGYVRHRRDGYDAAVSEMRRAVSLDADYDFSMRQLVEGAPDPVRAREAVDHAAAELNRQVVLGDGWLCFQQIAGRGWPPGRVSRQLMRALRRQPETWHFELSQALRMQGDRDGARQACEAALAMSPGWNSAVRQQVDLLIEGQPDYAAAERVVARALHHAHEDDDLIALLAWLHERQKRPEEALREARRSLLLNPRPPWVWGLVRRICDTGERLHDFDALVDEVERSRPGDAAAWTVRASQGRDDAEALAAAERAVALDPRMEAAWVARFERLARLSRHDEIETLLQSLPWPSEAPVALRAWGARCAWRRGGPDRGGVPDAGTAQGSAGRRIAVARPGRLGGRARSERRVSGGRAAVAALVPHRGAPHAYVGHALFKLGRHAEAVVDLRRAVELEGHYPFAATILCEAAERIGDVASIDGRWPRNGPASPAPVWPGARSRRPAGPAIRRSPSNGWIGWSTSASTTSTNRSWPARRWSARIGNSELASWQRDRIERGEGAPGLPSTG
ncbi:peptidase like family domain-containing protein [Ditylenchus destructor]|nr:peptidase like family domain-containing protein [Ditylenchus destructor]